MNRFNLLAPVYDVCRDNIFNHYLATSKKILRFVDIKPTDYVLDIGGGRGSISNLLKLSTGANFVVVDPAEKVVEKGRSKYAQIDFVHAQAEYLPFPDQSFDVVLMIGMLHFTDNPELALKEAGRVLKNGGKIFVNDMDFSNLLNNYLLRPIKTLVLDKTQSFTPIEVDTALSKYGFTSERHTTDGLLISAVKAAY